MKDEQKLLEIIDIKERLETLIAFLNNEIEILKVEEQIHKRVKTGGKDPEGILSAGTTQGY